MKYTASLQFMAIKIAAISLASPLHAQAPKSKQDFIYFCVGEDAAASNRRYGVKVSEIRQGKSTGFIHIRAHDAKEANSAFRLDRGELMQFRIVDTDERCAKYGWKAVTDSHELLMCTATQGVADLEINDLKGSPTFQVGSLRSSLPATM